MKYTEEIKNGKSTLIFKNEEDFFIQMTEYSEEEEEFEEYKDKKLSLFDSEKGSVEVTKYLRRISDGKKFIANYTKWGQGDSSTDDTKWYEVVSPIKKTPTTWQDLKNKYEKKVGDNYDHAGYIDWLKHNYKVPSIIKKTSQK